MTNCYSLVRPSSDKTGASENEHHGSALGTDSYTLPSGTGPGTTGKPGTTTDCKYTRCILLDPVNNLHSGVQAKQVQDTTNGDVTTVGTKSANGNGKFLSKHLAVVDSHVFQALLAIAEGTLTRLPLRPCHRTAHLKMLCN